MGRDVRIGVVGATGAIGKEILTVLDAAPWRPDAVMAIARATTTTPRVSYGEEDLPVEDAASADLGSLHGLIVAVPAGDAGDLVQRAVDAGVPVVDVSGSQLDDMGVPVVVPWVDGTPLDAPRSRDVVTIPSAPATLLHALLAPLAAGGWSGDVDATVLVPASTWGRDAIDELSRQVVALFNAGTPPRKVFPQGLAFDALPAVGVPGGTGWTTAEVRAAAELGRLSGQRAQVTLVGAPLFSGMSATVRLTAPDDLSPEAVASLLAGAGVTVVDHADLRSMPRPRRVEGEAGLHVARIRSALGGGGLHLWASMDNLRATAVAAVGAMAHLAGRLDADA